MITPKEKAKEIYNKFCTMKSHCDDAQECALIAVEEIFDSGLLVMLDDEQYWFDVKTEIKNL